MTSESAGHLSPPLGFKQGVDFQLGYSTERINPGDNSIGSGRRPRSLPAEEEEGPWRGSRCRASSRRGLYFGRLARGSPEAEKVIENTNANLT